MVVTQALITLERHDIRHAEFQKVLECVRAWISVVFFLFVVFFCLITPRDGKFENIYKTMSPYVCKKKLYHINVNICTNTAIHRYQGTLSSSTVNAVFRIFTVNSIIAAVNSYKSGTTV